MRSYVPLHVHSDGSNFDGYGSPEDFVVATKKMRAPAMALTEHGTVRSAFELYEACEKHNLKAIYGCELFLCDDMHKCGLTDEEKAAVIYGLSVGERSEAIYQEEVKRGVRGRHHLTALAMNDVGLRNLFALVSMGWKEGFYKRPRIDVPLLKSMNEGIILLSGCPASVSAKAVAEGDRNKAIKTMLELHETFEDRFYIEIMPHDSGEGTTPPAPGLVKLARDLGLPLVATQDAHYPKAEDAQWQEAMLCVRTDDALISPKRFKFHTRDFYMKNRAEMEAAFDALGIENGAIKEALDNTHEISERCVAKLPVGRKPLLPAVPIPRRFNDSQFEYLRWLCHQGWEKLNVQARAERYAEKRVIEVEQALQIYRDRLEEELTEIKRREIPGYFLVVADLVAWVRSQGKIVGPGRGSAGGCFVAFLLKITSLDPIQHGLLFSRFLSPGRSDLPDIDLDFSDRDREMIIAHLIEKYGQENVCRIGTVGTLKGRGALKDVARILLIPREEAERVSPWIEEPIGEDRPDSTYEQAIKDSKKKDAEEGSQVVLEFHQKYPLVLDYCRALEGSPKSLGVHASGVIVTPQPLMDLVPLEIREQKGKNRNLVVTGFTMDAVAKIGLVKIDILAIKNLAVIEDCIKFVEQGGGPKYTLDDLDNLDLEDGDTIEAFSAGLVCGVFQFDTFAMRKMCEGMVFRNFEDVAAATALVRPGTSRSKFGEKYLARMRGQPTPKVHPIYDAICAPTFGVPVYQEQFMLLFSELAGYSPAETNDLRKKCAKKHGASAVLAERERFMSGAKERGMPEEVSGPILDELASFGQYSFNKSHSVGYAKIAFWEMWLKLNHAVEFFAAWLGHDDSAQENDYADSELETFGIRVGSPDINIAGSAWTFNDNNLVPPLNVYKGIGVKAVEAIQEARPFDDFSDLALRMNRKACNLRVIKILHEAGALGSIVPEGTDIEELVAIWDQTKPKPVRKKKGEEPTIEIEETEEDCE